MQNPLHRTFLTPLLSGPSLETLRSLPNNPPLANLTMALRPETRKGIGHLEYYKNLRHSPGPYNPKSFSVFSLDFRVFSGHSAILPSMALPL